MSVYLLKWLAAIAMLLDHTAVVFGGELSASAVLVLRCVGRISFPIFAYLAAEGWRHTHDRTKYLERLLLGALASAVPYAMVVGAEWPLRWQYGTLHTLLLAAICLLAVRVTGRGRLSVLFVLCMLISGLFPRQSVFFTLAYGLCLLALLDRPRDGNILAALAAALIFALIVDFDYGLMGAALIVAFFLFPQARLASVGVFAALYLTYGLNVTNALYAVSCLLAAVPILCANGMLGRPKQRFFYVFYPAHLLVLALVKTIFL